ncbi:MAG: RluA family pseudouridine synthase [Oscillospiraceae bacterium]|nr:RluA family pseudouridine synthase [Oscillospiraceae bacterium]
MKELTAGKNDAGRRLDRFLMKAFPLTAGVVMKALRNKKIKVNGGRAKAAYKLAENDVVRIFLGDGFLSETPRAISLDEIPSELSVIYEDENILLADKPAGLLCHEGGGNSPPDTLINRVKAYLYKKGEFIPENENGFEPALCNRLDRNTRGVVIAAKTAEALRVLNEKIKRREIKKLYLCILTGVPKEKAATLTAYLEKDGASNTVKISGKKTPQNKTIVTSYRVIGERGGMALAEIDLVTGRTHQIRAHMAHIGHPLLGDGKYGRLTGKGAGFKNQALCGYKIIFTFKESCSLDYLNGRSFEADKTWLLGKFNGL